MSTQDKLREALQLASRAIPHGLPGSFYATARAAVDEALAALAAQQAEPVAPSIVAALRFYAQRHHFALSDPSAWDTVSGEPRNYWCDEAGTATVEDGSIAKIALEGINAPQPAREAVVLTEEQIAEALRLSGPDLLELAKLWADNALHTYGFSARAERIVADACRKAERAVWQANNLREPT